MADQGWLSLVRVALLCALLTGCAFHCTGIEHELGASVGHDEDGKTVEVMTKIKTLWSVK